MLKSSILTSLTKATSLTIHKTYTTKKGTPHYALTFHNVPYIDYNHYTLYSDIILNDCTFTFPKFTSKIKTTITPTKTVIHNFQTFLYTTPFIINYHPTKKTTQVIKLTYPDKE